MVPKGGGGGIFYGSDFLAPFENIPRGLVDPRGISSVLGRMKNESDTDIITLLDLRHRYREAVRAYGVASTEAARSDAASRMAVAITELQHPRMVRAATLLRDGGI